MSSNTLIVDLGERSYPIYIGRGLLGDPSLLSRHLSNGPVAIVSNETVAPLYLDRLRGALGDRARVVVVLPDGEQYKNLECLATIYDRLLESGCDRQTTLIALGGGVVGDMAGFAAATFQRGVHFIQVPTTLLAQVDSSVGGKTGVNHPRGKNMIGAFYQPRCVIADTDTLATLPAREYAAGFAEVIKYGLIADRAFYDWIARRVVEFNAREPGVLIEAIRRSCANKARVVAEDEREGGRRAILNFGHTFAHAIETGTHYSRYLHGEAVAIGMLLAADLSRRLGWIDSSDVAELRFLLERAGLPVSPPADMSVERFLDLMAADKKVVAGRLRLVLLRGIGSAVVSADFPHHELNRTLIDALGGGG